MTDPRHGNGDTEPWPVPGAPISPKRRNPIHFVTYPLILIVGLGIGLFAGRTGDDAPASAANVPVVATTTAAATTAATTPSPTATVHKVGSTVKSDGITVRLRSFKNNVKLDVSPDGPGNHWAAAEVETCWTGPIAGVTGDTISLSWDPWSLIDTEHHRFGAFSSGSTPGWKEPVYPEFGDDVVKLGECVRGWMEFPVTDGAKITEVRYAPESTASVNWQV